MRADFGVRRGSFRRAFDPSSRSRVPRSLLFPRTARTTIQIKTHAQVVLRKLDRGEDVFAELDDDDVVRRSTSGAAGESAAAVGRRRRHREPLEAIAAQSLLELSNDGDELLPRGTATRAPGKRPEL